MSEILLLSSTASMAEYAEPRLIRSKMEIELPTRTKFLIDKELRTSFRTRHSPLDLCGQSLESKDCWQVEPLLR